MKVSVVKRSVHPVIKPFATSPVKNSVNKLTILAAAFTAFSSTCAYAQQIKVDGNIDPPYHAPDGTSVNTGTATGSAGYAVWVLDGGQFTADGSISLTTGGANAFSLIVSSGSQANLMHGGTLTSAASYAMYIDDGSTVNADGLTMNSGGTSVFLNSTTSAVTQLNLSNSDITSSGGFGLHALHNNALIVGTDLTIRTTGNNHQAVEAFDGARVTLDGSSFSKNQINTSGDESYGLYAQQNGSKITTTGALSITTQGARAHGIYAKTTGIIELNGTKIETNGVDAIGANADSGAQVSLTNVAITTNRQTAHGVMASDLQTALSSVDAQIVTYGDAAVGVRVQDQAVVNMTNGSIVTYGSGSHALSSGEQGVLTLNQQGGQLSSAQGTTFSTDGGSITAVIDGVSVLNDGSLINAQAGSSTAGFVDLTAANLQMSGDIQADSTSTANLKLRSASWTGKAINATDFDLDNGSTWNMAASSDVNTLAHAGLINFASPTGGNFNTLTVRSHYTGNGGTLALNTQLGDDSSSSDLLRVQGDTSGSSKLHINNSGGTGALTTADGIKVVEVNGLSNGAFQLDGRLIAGAYEYDLYQGGVGANASDGNWYLRSQATPRPETGVYLRNLSAASNMFMHTLHDRLGEPQFADTYKTDGSSPSVWVRIMANRTDSSAADGQIDLSTDTTLVHIGGDIARWSSNGSDRWHLGVMGAYGQSDTDADATRDTMSSSGYKRTASGKVDGYSIGAYATWYGNKDKPTGPYVDLWGQYAWYDNTVQGNGLKEESYDSTGWILSVEGGYAFALGGSNTRQWMIEPQAQLAYSSYSADDHRETNGTWVRDGNSDGVLGRLGARLYSRSQLNDNAIQPFVEVNWWYNSAEYDLDFNGQVVSDDTPDNTFQLKAGLQGEIAKGWQVWGHIGGRWGSDSYSSYEGMIGVKHTF